MEIKLPRVKVEVREDEGFSLGKLSPALIVGFGAHWAWVYLTMFNGQQLFFWNAADPAVPAGLFHPVSLVFFVMTLLSYGVLSRAYRRLFATQRRRARLRFIGATLGFAGTLFMCLADVGSAAGIAALAAGGATTGIGSAILLMSYGVSFGQCDIATIVTSTALSLVAGIALYTAVSNLDLLHPLGALAAALIPFLECWCLYRCSTALVDKLEFAAITLKVRKTPFALRLCAPSLLFGFALMIAVMLTQRQHINFMFRPLLPLIAIALVAVYFIADATPFTTFALLLCYLLFEGTMWVSYADITQRFRLTSFVVFGFGRGALALGALIGMTASFAIPALDSATNPANTLIIVFACIIFGFGALPRGSELRALIVGESDNPAGEMLRGRERAESPEKARAGRFKRKCELVANRYLLSKKETEVLFLLAKGRNAAYIQEQLYISEGTARTHMRHIYKKLDIHTQQELMDLVEGSEEEVA